MLNIFKSDEVYFSKTFDDFEEIRKVKIFNNNIFMVIGRDINYKDKIKIFKVDKNNTFDEIVNQENTIGSKDIMIYNQDIYTINSSSIIHTQSNSNLSINRPYERYIKDVVSNSKAIYLNSPLSIRVFSIYSGKQTAHFVNVNEIKHIAIDKNNLYTLDINGRLQIYELSNPEIPRLIKTIDFDELKNSNNFKIDEDYIFAVDSNNKILIYKNNLGQIKLIDQWISSNSDSFYIYPYVKKGKLLLVNYDKSLTVLDIKGKVKEISNFSFPQIKGLGYHNDYIYIYNLNQISILNLNDLPILKPITVFDLSLDPKTQYLIGREILFDLNIYGNILYLTIGSIQAVDTLLVALNIDNPVLPVQQNVYNGKFYNINILDKNIVSLHGHFLDFYNLSAADRQVILTSNVLKSS